MESSKNQLKFFQNLSPLFLIMTLSVLEPHCYTRSRSMTNIFCRENHNKCKKVVKLIKDQNVKLHCEEAIALIAGSKEPLAGKASDPCKCDGQTES